MNQSDEELEAAVRIRLEAEAAGDASVYQAGRDQHFHYADGVRGVRRTVQGTISDECPYPGLVAFGPAQAHWFFGRDQLTADLMARLSAGLTVGGPLMVVAPSGAGKSSLLRAGLLPALDRGALPAAGSHRWPQITFTPTAHPMRQIAAHIAAIGAATGDLGEQRVADARGLTVLLDRQLRERADADGLATCRAVIVVDQLEELFTLCEQEAEREEFTEWLWQVAQPIPGKGPLALIACGLRADFYAQCANYHRLRVALQDNQLYVGPMSRDELREAILFPAQDVGLDMEPGLPELLLRDLGTAAAGDASKIDDPAADYAAGRLPLLAHALQATWQQRHGNTMTVDAYNTTGGIEHAVSTTAERAFNSIDPASRQEARSVFLHLIEIGDNGEDVRKPVNRAELLRDSRNPDGVRAVLDAFTSTRLIIQTMDNVQISHEALIRAWPRLRQWIDQDRAGNLIRQELEETALGWDRHDRDKGDLYRGNRLDAAHRWAMSASRDDLSPVAATFLAASQRQQWRAVRLRRGAIAGLVLLALLASAIAVVAFQQRATAQAARDQAIFGQTTAEAGSLRGTDVSLAAQLDLVSYRMRPTQDIYTSILSLASQPLSTPLRGTAGAVYSVAFSPDDKLLATGSEYGQILLWDVANAARPVRLSALTGSVGRASLIGPENIIYSVVFDPRGRVLASGGSDGSVRLWNLASLRRPTVTELPHPGVGVFALAFSRDGRILAVGNSDGTIELWNVTNIAKPTLIGRLAAGGGASVASIAFSPVGNILASGNANGNIALWNVANPARPRLEGPAASIGASEIVHSLAFSPSGRVLAIGGQGSDVTLWSVSHPGHPVLLDQASSNSILPVHALAFRPDGQVLASASGDTVQLWSYSKLSGLVPVGQPLTGVTGDVISMVFSADGRRLVTGGADGTTRLWAIPRVLLVGHDSIVRSVAFSQRGHLLADGTQDGAIELWSVADPARPAQLSPSIQTGSGSIGSVAFSPDGQTLAVGGDGGVVQLWDVADPRKPAMLQTFIERGAGAINTVAFSPNGRLLADGSLAGTLQLLRVSPAPGFLGPPMPDEGAGAVESVAFSPDGHTLAVGTAAGTLQLWQVDDGALSLESSVPSAASGTIFAVAFRPDGHVLATGSEDDTAQLWGVTSPTHPVRLGRPLTSTGYVFSIAFSPDGQTLAGGISDGTVGLWDVARPADATAIGQPLTSSGVIFAVAFSPDDSLLATGSSDGAVELLPVKVSQAINWICAAIPGILTPQLWHRYVGGLPYQPPCRRPT